IIHRTIRVWVDEETGERFYETKGDHNRNQVQQPPILDETRIDTQQVVGRAVARIPYLGYVKIWFVNIIEYITGRSVAI
ncbi:hypothetical protein GOV10_06225, partial [Candidatus Woesearchaeota archaeon]|nr:hypothetical protein [Candidatus Woesearchaeota archaeon]